MPNNFVIPRLDLPIVPWEIQRLDPFLRTLDSEESAPKQTGEELFKDLLNNIKEIYEVDATIAGGAVRDVFAEVYKHKDIDVFIPLTFKAFMEREVELGLTHPVVLTKNKPYKGVDIEVFKNTVRATTWFKKHPLDLIFIKGGLTKEIVDNFPIYTQQCIFSLEMGLIASPLAKTDIENKQFTINPSIKDKEQLKGLMQKTKDWCKRPGYKGWKIIEPDIKEWWEVKKELETKPMGTNVNWTFSA